MRLVLLLKAKKAAKPKKSVAAVIKTGLHKEKRRNKKGVLVTKIVKNAPAVTGKKQAKGSKVLADKPKRKTKAKGQKMKNVFESLRSHEVHPGEDVFYNHKELSEALTEHGFSGGLNKKEAAIFRDGYERFHEAEEAKEAKKLKNKKGSKPSATVRSIPENEFSGEDHPTPHTGPLNKDLIGRFLDKKFPGQEMTITPSGDKEFPYRLTNTSPAMKQHVHIDDLTEKQIKGWLKDMKPAQKRETK